MARSKKPTTNEARKRTPKKPADINSLEATRDQAKEDHRLAKQTTKNYNRYVARGKDFLKQLVTSIQERLKADATLPEDEHPYSSSELQELAGAFDVIPNTQSVRALELYITQKCFTEGCGGNTASGIHAGFKRYWDKKSVFIDIYYLLFKDFSNKSSPQS